MELNFRVYECVYIVDELYVVIQKYGELKDRNEWVHLRMDCARKNLVFELGKAYVLRKILVAELIFKNLDFEAFSGKFTRGTPCQSKS